ncbi:hypothetical protein MAR_011849 [Mya arenaria]|uniref:Cysteine and tyrosine-rich protein 1 n=1 Tax=Mya arenaria TaxID=6604 RepID=A0ABY7FVX6_MYAAR|nr:hypothetical protein MAR_011849 [Mya arenaria]
MELKVSPVIVLSLCFGVNYGATEMCVVDEQLRFCEYGCCGDACCGLTTMAIIGIVIGAIMTLVAIVGCVICIACMCKQSGRTGQNVQPYNNTNSVVVNHGGGYGHPPPQYSNAGRSNYGNYNDPVYPPGMVNEQHPPPAYSYSAPKY